MTLIRNKKSEKKIDLIDLPELQADQANVGNIVTVLQNGATIWGWYKMHDYRVVNGSRYLNVPAISNISYGFDGLTALRKYNCYLIYYKVDVDAMLGIYLRPTSIYSFKNSNIAALCSSELSNAHKLYLDNNSNFFAQCGQYIYNMDDKNLESYTALHRGITIAKEDLRPWQKRSKQFINPDALSLK